MDQLFRRRLREARERKGLTQQQLAKLASVSRSAVTQWEAGSTFPSTSNLMLLSKMLDYNFVDDGRSSEPLLEGAVKKEGFLANDYAFIPLFATTMILSIGTLAKGKMMADMTIADIASDSLLRPHPLRLARSAYAFQMATTKLEPRFFLGELAYANARIIPSIYDYTVARVTDGENPDLAFVGRLMSFDEEDGLVLLRHRPDGEISIRSDQIVRLDRIYTWAELIRPVVDASDEIVEPPIPRGK